MQSKGIVKFFLVLLILICASQFIYLFPIWGAEKKADQYAENQARLAPADQKEEVKKFALAHYLDSISSEKIVKVPVVGTSYTYQELKAKQLALGLDLKGGMSVLLQVDLSDFLKSLSNKSTDPDFKKAIETATAEQKVSQADYITLFADEFKKSGKSLASIFMRNEGLKGQINLNTSDAAVQAIIRQQANATVNETFNRLQKRIDKLGVVQPNISLDKSRDMIMVELPGIENPERARAFLKNAAKLEFWDVYRVSDPGVASGLQEADNRLKLITAGQPDTGKLDSAKMANRGPLFSLLTPTPTQYGTAAVIGTADKNKKQLISSYLTRPEIASLFPQDLEFRWSKDASKGVDGKTGSTYELFALKKAVGKEGPALEGDHVIAAQENLDPTSGQVEVSLKMDGVGAAAWRDLTTKASADNKREVAIVLDSDVVSAPSVRVPITDGNSSITGNYTVQDAQDLAGILTVGRLPAQTEIVQEQTVGPTLGAENIQRSLVSLAVALIAIIVFMSLYYSTGGIVAVIALLANLFFIIGALSSFGTVLTLPGIAGIVLTMGIAVDANVIIYERIREELHQGKALTMAIRDGFVRSAPAIIDGNVTNIISAVVLGYFGLGPVKGFAIVLLIGVLFTLFTSLLVTRLIIEWWTGTKGKDIKFSSSWSENAFKGINVDWMKMRRTAYVCSSAFILAGVIAFFVRGFDLGVDFKGGYSYNVQFDKSKSVNQEALKNALTAGFNNQSTIVKTVSTQNTFNVTTSYLVNESSTEAQDKVTQNLFNAVQKSGLATGDYETFKKTSSPGTHITSSSKVGPMVAADIIRSSLWANFLALALIFIYILIRFRRWQYSTGAVIALFHDVLFILSCFTLFHGLLPFSLEVDQVIVAAVLTISAYSMNDTVIVYDRIREYSRTYSNMSMRDVINAAINSTLSRTIITSFNVLLVVLILFIFGGSSIKGFAFALIVGIFIGTYSSIFIASPIMMDLSKNLNLSDNAKPTIAPPTVVDKKKVVKAKV